MGEAARGQQGSSGKQFRELTACQHVRAKPPRGIKINPQLKALLKIVSTNYCSDRQGRKLLLLRPLDVAANQAAEKVTLNRSGVKTPEETKAFMSRLKPRPTKILNFSHRLRSPDLRSPIPTRSTLAWSKSLSRWRENSTMRQTHSPAIAKGGMNQP
jgi:hypothetical protein